MTINITVTFVNCTTKQLKTKFYVLSVNLLQSKALY